MKALNFIQPAKREPLTLSALLSLQEAEAGSARICSGTSPMVAVLVALFEPQPAIRAAVCALEPRQQTPRVENMRTGQAADTLSRINLLDTDRARYRSQLRTRLCSSASLFLSLTHCS